MVLMIDNGEVNDWQCC